MGIPQGKHTEKMIEKMIVGTPAYLCKRLSQDKPKHLLFFLCNGCNWQLYSHFQPLCFCRLLFVLALYTCVRGSW
jgi:hypothetical protein